VSFRYIGSKARVVDQLQTQIGPHTGGFFVDAFCGTGAVAEAAANMGWPVRINDNLISAVISASARLYSVEQVPFIRLGGYQEAINKLNSADPTKGFIWRSYSPASIDECGIERRYFSEGNAGRIDAMRAMIRDWRISGVICEIEERLLIADLFSALNRVANIAGTFGCFMAKWTPQSDQTINLRARHLKTSAVRVETSVGDVFNVRSKHGDVVYLDPPYTKRQYASYYHILETVALGDEPIIEGVAGLRPWKDRASDFCYKTRALSTLTRLIKSIDAQRVMLSYSSEGHITIEDLQSSLSRIGELVMHPIGSIGRYRPNKVASDAGARVTEYLAIITRGTRPSAIANAETVFA
jgi:adenine-specific DNA-methyltransferase